MSPEAWLPLVGQPAASVTVEDADLATVVSGAVDKVLRIHTNPEYLLHLEFVAGHDTARLPPRLRLYNILLDYRHDSLVLTVAVLLHSGADSPQLDGRFQRAFPGEEPYAFLRYRVLRVWELPVQQLLTGGLGTLPLAPISNVGREDLPEVIHRMKRRLQRIERQQAADIWAATYLLVGLRYSEAVAKLLLREVMGMRESATYQAILREGRAEGRAEGAIEEARRLLFLMGEEQFGPPDEVTTAAVRRINDLRRLEEMGQRLFKVQGWQELLRRPAARRRNGRRKKND